MLCPALISLSVYIPNEGRNNRNFALEGTIGKTICFNARRIQVAGVGGTKLISNNEFLMEYYAMGTATCVRFYPTEEQQNDWDGDAGVVTIYKACDGYPDGVIPFLVAARHFALPRMCPMITLPLSLPPQ